MLKRGLKRRSRKPLRVLGAPMTRIDDIVTGRVELVPIYHFSVSSSCLIGCRAHQLRQSLLCLLDLRLNALPDCSFSFLFHLRVNLLSETLEDLPSLILDPINFTNCAMIQQIGGIKPTSSSESTGDAINYLKESDYKRLNLRTVL